MTLVETKDDILSSCEDPTSAIQAFDAGAVVWRRDTFLGPSESCYFIIQVVDGLGKKILPTWNTFVVQEQQCNGVACPKNIFSSLKEDVGTDAGFCQCAYTGDLPYGLENIVDPFQGKGGGKGKGLADLTRRGLQGSSNAKRKNRKEVNPGGVADHARKLQTVCQA